MLIYSHSVPEKLEPISLSTEYIQDATDLCGLVDDDDIGIDVQMAIYYTGALTGNPDKIRTFLDSIVLSGYALDASTLNHYVNRARQNPVFYPYIDEVERDFYRGDFDIRDCLNSPCNYFAPTSNNIGTMADIASSLNYSTTPTLTSLSSIPAGFAIGMATLNKIPRSLQESFGELTSMTTDIFKNAMSIFNDDEEKERLQKEAIESGNSYRSSSISDVYTADYRSYFDVSTAASDLLGQIANKMGNCFRLYQYQHRYNPFDYRMNMQTANKSAVLRKVDNIYTAMGYNGVNLDSAGDFNTSSNNFTMSPWPARSGGFTELDGNGLIMHVTVFGGYYEAATKTLYSDGSDLARGPKGFEYMANTAAGVGHRGSAYIYTPSIERKAIDKIAAGYTYPSNPTTIKDNQFNRGFATDKQTIYKYFDALSTDITHSDINRAISNGTLQARVKFNGTTRLIPIVDTKGPSVTNGRPVIDITADAIVDLFGLKLDGAKGTTSGSIDLDIISQITRYIGFKGASSTTAQVEFLIDGKEPTITPPVAPTQSPVTPPLPDHLEPAPIESNANPLDFLPPKSSINDTQIDPELAALEAKLTANPLTGADLEAFILSQSD